MAPRCVINAKAVLGEGPLWDHVRAVLWWLDIKGHLLHRHDPATGENRRQALPLRLTALALRADGRLLACGDEGFGHLDPDSGAFTPWVDVTGEPEGNRFNDGKVDAEGRFWAGTMDDSEQSSSGALYRLDASGTTTRMADAIGVPNGPAFDNAGQMYFTDSGLRTIFRYPGGGAPREVFSVFREEHGYPDGMTFDSEGHLWVAFWDGWCVRRLSSDGEIVAELPLPVQRPTSCTFGGAALDILYVTSATIGLNEAALAAQPEAGGLFAINGVAVGRPTELFQ